MIVPQKENNIFPIKCNSVDTRFKPENGDQSCPRNILSVKSIEIVKKVYGFKCYTPPSEPYRIVLFHGICHL